MRGRALMRTGARVVVALLLGLFSTGSAWAQSSSPAPPPLVYILGEVKSPGAFGIGNGMTLERAIELAGGLTDRGSPAKVTLIRQGEPARTLDLPGLLTRPGEDVELRGGDVLIIGAGDVQVTGAVRKAGAYDLEGLTVLQAIALAGGKTDLADLKAATVTRDNKKIPVDLEKLYAGKELQQNITLRKGDALHIPERKMHVTIEGAVARPGMYDLNEEAKVQDLLKTAGGPTPNAVLTKVALVRIENGKKVGKPLDLTRSDAANNPALQNDDHILVPSKGGKGGLSVRDVMNIIVGTYYLDSIFRRR